MNLPPIISQNKTNVKKYLIGSVVIAIEASDSLPTSPNLSIFLYQGSQRPQVMYKVRELPFTDQIIEKICAEFNSQKEIRREDRVILLNESLESRLIFFHGADKPYGIYLERTDTEIEIFIDTSVRHMMVYDAVFLSLFGMEKQMLKQNALILHCAYMCRNGKAILFSAPSGTGKSTQADLWEKHRVTRTINGDKALLYRHADGWYAHGWPICGSSEICHDEVYPIKAIVMLHQAPDNSIRPLQGFELVKKLMAQITINMWNPDFQLKAMDLIDIMAAEIPVYELGCNISEGAVKCLESVL